MALEALPAESAGERAAKTADLHRKRRGGGVLGAPFGVVFRHFWMFFGIFEGFLLIDFWGFLCFLILIQAHEDITALEQLDTHGLLNAKTNRKRLPNAQIWHVSLGSLVVHLGKAFDHPSSVANAKSPGLST